MAWIRLSGERMRGRLKLLQQAFGEEWARQHVKQDQGNYQQKSAHPWPPFQKQIPVAPNRMTLNGGSKSKAITLTEYPLTSHPENNCYKGKKSRHMPAFFNPAALFEREDPRHQVLMLASLTFEFGGMGTGPQTLASLLHFFFQTGLGACVVLYLAAISFSPGPTSFYRPYDSSCSRWLSPNPRLLARTHH
jgi:hypothetical protein